MTKFLLKKLLPSLIIASLILPELVVAAVDTGLKQAQQELQQARKEEEGDKDPCKPDEQGIGGAIQQATNNLGRTISNGLRQNFSQTISQTISQNLQRIVQQQLTQNLPRLIETELSQQLPNLLRQKLQGYPQSEWNQRGPGLMQESVRELLPNIIHSGLPSMLRQGISNDLRSTLAVSFSSQVPSILEGSDWFQNAIGQLIGGLLGLLGPLFSGGSNSLLDNIQDGIANDAGNGIADSAAIDKIVAQIMPVIMRVVLNGVQGGNQQGLLSQLGSGQLGGVVDNFGQSGGFQNATSGFDFNDWAGNNITAAIGFDLAPVSQAIARPLALSIVSGLGISGYDGAIGNLGAIGYSGPINVGVLQAAAGFDSTGVAYAQRLGGYNGPLTPNAVGALNAGNLAGDFSQFPSPLNDNFVPPSFQELSNADFLAANPEFVGPPAPIDSLGTDAASAVDGTNIANNSVASLGLGDQISTSLKGGLANGLSGGIGNLVDGIPYVGGFISPIAEEITNVLLMEALGLPDGLTGIPTQDIGVHQAVVSGFKNSTKTLVKPLGKIQQATKQSNDNEEDIIKNQARQESVAIKDCLKNKSTLFSIKNLETMFRVYNPAAWAGSMVLTATALKNFQEFKTNAVPDRFGGEDNNQGHSTTADITQNWNDATEEALLKASYLLKQSGNAQDAATARLLEALTQQNQLPAATMTQNEWETFKTSAPSLRKPEFWNSWLKAIDNDPTTRKLEGLEYALTNASKQKEQATVQYIASGGVNDLVECKQWSSFVELKPVCIGGWEVKTRGSTVSQRENILAVVDILKLVMASNYKEDSVGPLGKLIEMFNADGSIDPNSLVLDENNPCPGLEPCDPSQQYRQSGYDVTNYGLIDQYSFGTNFTNSLNQAVNTGVTNLSNQGINWTTNQINSLSGYLDSGIRGAGFTNGNFSSATSCDFTCQGTLNGVVVSSLGQAGLGQGQDIVAELIALIIELLINHSGQ